MKTTFEIQNFKCNGCATTILNKLTNIDGIDKVSVETEISTVTFFYKNDSNILEAKNLLNKIGYPVVGERNALTTKAKSFVSCTIGKMTK
ncbi:heavy-metal-associated domain-containing protein [Thalassobellus suaedae]|uniref:Heavy-metal-associated domain-containing protein n=1 Tax=Thalassobellus suaedae TaxID=3074124 RepID=A0ABY9Y427_9FLAO|nr:heavy-metal-associated domain-containing protein [Flavobacteriaceae bacterium HL-DH14]WNH12981.1 heavy-metal-associated domain-containing protein [Flavobacteriaceae bacterium HL-DH10]